METQTTFPASGLERAAIEALESHSLFRGRTRHLEIEDHDGELVLRGQLPSFYLKQVLQTVVRGIQGVRRVDNRVDVGHPHGSLFQFSST